MDTDKRAEALAEALHEARRALSGVPASPDWEWRCDWQPDDLNPGPECPYCAGQMCARFDGLGCTHDRIERHGYSAAPSPDSALRAALDKELARRGLDSEPEDNWNGFERGFHEAVLFARAALDSGAEGGTVHLAPPGAIGERVTPCCGKEPRTELPWNDRLTLDPSLVTCRGAEGGTKP